jgi:serine/threonine protein kinase
VVRHADGQALHVLVEIDETTSGFAYVTLKRRAVLKPPRRRTHLADAPLVEKDMDSLVINSYELGRVLGAGGYGVVREAEHSVTGVKVAVKTLLPEKFLAAGIDYSVRERNLVMKLQHPNICRWIESFSVDRTVYIVSELVAGGELFDLVAQKGRLSEAEARPLIRQLLSAVDYLHRCGVCHRDLKLENTLLDVSGRVKLIDFGLGAVFRTPENKTIPMKTMCGTPDYSAPELWSLDPYDGAKVDIWALGVMIYIIISGFLPFSDTQSILDIAYKFPDSANIHFSLPLRDLLKKIFRPAAHRADMEKILKHTWVSDAGALPSIDPVDPQKEGVALNDNVIAKMEELGFERGAVVRGIKRNDDVIAVTYKILQCDEEKQVRAEKAQAKPMQKIKEEKCVVQ